VQWLRQQRPVRIALVGLLFPVPLLSVASAALVAMTATRDGWRIAMQDCVGAWLLLVAVTLLAGGYWVEMAVGAAITWVVALQLGHLRRVASLALATQVAVLLGSAGVLVFSYLSDDPVGFWEQVLAELAERARSAGLEVDSAALSTGLAPMMTGVMAGSAVASALAALFLGCWWANGPGARSFGAEFRGLGMGVALGALTALLGLLFLFGLRAMVDDLLLVLAVGFVIQGLAVVHWYGARAGWPRVWPLALYLPLVLLPSLAAAELMLLALLGFADNAFSLRRGMGKVV
jgi:hypothetical protein